MNKKQKIVIGIGMVAFIVIQVILRHIKINNTGDLLIIAIMVTACIVFVVSINVGKNKMNKRTRKTLSILMILVCIVGFFDILIADDQFPFFDSHKKLVAIPILLLNFLSFSSIAIYSKKIYRQMTKNNLK